MTQTEIEEKLVALEAEIRLLKGQLARTNGAAGSVSNNSKAASPNKADPKWVLAHAGRFDDDPGFDEVVRLGREYRESLRPKPKKKPTASRKPKRR